MHSQYQIFMFLSDSINGEQFKFCIVVILFIHARECGCIPKVSRLIIVRCTMNLQLIPCMIEIVVFEKKYCLTLQDFTPVRKSLDLVWESLFLPNNHNVVRWKITTFSRRFICDSIDISGTYMCSKNNAIQI